MGKCFEVSNQDDLETIRTDGFKRKCDEILGFVEAAKLALKNSELELPFRAEVEPDPPQPDVLIYGQRTTIGVEVTRVTWQCLAEVAKSANPGEKIEMTQNLLTDRPARRGRDGSKDRRSGDYGAIKISGQPLDGAGFLGDELEELMFDALCKAIKKKAKRIHGYRKNIDRIWLFLKDDTLPSEIRDVIEIDKPKLDKLCSESGFDRIIWFGSGKVISTIWPQPIR